jgi:hypothetical protein
MTAQDSIPPVTTDEAHIIYKRRDPWDYPEHLYQTLCDECHDERQRLTDKAVDAVRIAISKVPSIRLIKAVQKLCAEAMLEIEVDKESPRA